MVLALAQAEKARFSSQHEFPCRLGGRERISLPGTRAVLYHRV